MLRAELQHRVRSTLGPRLVFEWAERGMTLVAAPRRGRRFRRRAGASCHLKAVEGRSAKAFEASNGAKIVRLASLGSALTSGCLLLKRRLEGDADRIAARSQPALMNPAVGIDKSDIELAV